MAAGKAVIRAISAPWYDGINVAVISSDKKSVGKITYHPIEEGEVIEEAVVLNMSNAQMLMNDLWHCGLRPSNGEGSVGELKATQSHLKDMKTIAYKKLGINDNK